MATPKRILHRWTEAEDLVLCKTIAAIRPCTVKMWDSVLLAVNSDAAVSCAVTRRAVRERFDLLIKNHKKETSRRLAESGIVEVPTERTDLLDDHVAWYDDVENHKGIENEKKRKDLEEEQNKDVGIVAASMSGIDTPQSSGSSSTRHSPSEDDSGESVIQKRPRLSRKSVADVIAEKNALNADVKQRELDLLQQEINLDKERLRIQAEAQKMQAEDLAMLQVLGKLAQKLDS